MILQPTQHGYDRASNRLYRKQTVEPAGHDELYTYDALHRLVDVERGTLGDSFDVIIGFDRKFDRAPSMNGQGLADV